MIASRNHETRDAGGPLWPIAALFLLLFWTVAAVLAWALWPSIRALFVSFLPTTH